MKKSFKKTCEKLFFRLFVVDNLIKIQVGREVEEMVKCQRFDRDLVWSNPGLWYGIASYLNQEMVLMEWDIQR